MVQATGRGGLLPKSFSSVISSFLFRNVYCFYDKFYIVACIHSQRYAFLYEFTEKRGNKFEGAGTALSFNFGVV